MLNYEPSFAQPRQHLMFENETKEATRRARGLREGQVLNGPLWGLRSLIRGTNMSAVSTQRQSADVRTVPLTYHIAQYIIM